MNDENEKVDLLFKKNPNSKKIKKDKYPVDIEAERRFSELKTKYANAIAFLLVKNIARRNLQEYFEQGEENKRRFETIKRIRQQIIESRPKAKIWVDKPFYVKLDLGTPVGELGDLTVPIILGECVFKQPTKVVSSRAELEQYMETIAKIIDSEKIWADPDMQDFDVGEREYLAAAAAKKESE